MNRVNTLQLRQQSCENMEISYEFTRDRTEAPAIASLRPSETITNWYDVTSLGACDTQSITALRREDSKSNFQLNVHLVILLPFFVSISKEALQEVRPLTESRSRQRNSTNNVDTG